MINSDLLSLSLEVLEDMKAKAINKINVSELTSISDHMIFCTGTSSRHARSIVDKLSEKAKEEKHQILGIEGYESGQWILIDLLSGHDHLVHYAVAVTNGKFFPDSMHSRTRKKFRP